MTEEFNRIGHFTNKYTNSNVLDIIIRLPKSDIGKKTGLPYIITIDEVLRNKDTWRNNLDLIGYGGGKDPKISKDEKNYYDNLTNNTDDVEESSTYIENDTICGRTKQIILPFGDSYVTAVPLESSVINHHLTGNDITNKVKGINVGGGNPINVSVKANKGKVIEGKPKSYKPRRILNHGHMYTPTYKRNKKVSEQYVDYSIRLSKEDRKKLNNLLSHQDIESSNRIWEYNLHKKNLYNIIQTIICNFFDYYRNKEHHTNIFTPFNEKVLYAEYIDCYFTKDLYEKLILSLISEIVISKQNRDLIIDAIEKVKL